MNQTPRPMPGLDQTRPIHAGTRIGHVHLKVAISTAPSASIAAFSALS